MTPTLYRTGAPAPEAAIDTVVAPAISVIIVSYGTGPILIDTLASVKLSLGDTTAEVIVVDNPHPHVGQKARRNLQLSTSGVLVVEPTRNLGFGGGCELGAAHARGEFLAFINPDVTLAPRSLEHLIGTLTSTNASIVAPMLINPDGSVQEIGQSLFSDGTTRPDQHTPTADEIRHVDYSSAACWVMSRDEHERVGGFDPAFHPAYFEDVDFALRVRALGGSVVVDTSVSVIHDAGSGTPDQAAPAEAQRDELMRRWPSVRWTYRHLGSA